MFRKTTHYWTINDLRAAAAPYNTRTEFMRKEMRAYHAAYHKGVLDVICSHMKPSRKKNKFVVSYVNLATVIAPALNYDDLKSFREANSSAYDAGIRFGINFEELIENKDDASYLKSLITKLAEDSATYNLGKNRPLAPHLRVGA